MIIELSLYFSVFFVLMLVELSLSQLMITELRFHFSVDLFLILAELSFRFSVSLVCPVTFLRGCQCGHFLFEPLRIGKYGHFLFAFSNRTLSQYPINHNVFIINR
jgi:hypothetical protein